MQQQKPFLRAFFFLFLLACLLTGLVGTIGIPVGAVSTSIVISQVYGGGGNIGASYLNDYVEIFNLGTTSISLAGWSVQYAGATGTTWQVTNLSGSLAPGQYYLIQEAAGAGPAPSLPTPDASGSIPMAATAGKVALVNTTTALTGSGCPFNASVVDFVGYGTTADCFEGAGRAPTPSATASDLRGTNGCTDTDNNSNDFTTGTPNPRNSGASVNVCPPPTSTPTNTNTPTNTFTPTQTFTPSNTPIFSLTPSLTPVPGEVIISEVAWMGTGASTTDEWIELYNTRSTPIDLTDWRLVNATGNVDIVINGIIPANGFYLMERARDLTVSDAVADQIYSGGLADANDYLILSMASGTVIDTANSDGGAWPAGTGSPNFNSMERVITGGVAVPDSDVGWVSNTNSATWTKHDARGTSSTNYLIHGTPGYANWAFTVTATFTATITLTPTRTLTPTITSTSLPAATNIVISEFRTVGPNGGNDEFIELYNPTGSAIAIGGWTLRRSTGCGTTTALIATIPATVTLAAGQHYLVAGTNYSGSMGADLSANLGIANDGGIALLNSGGVIVDQVGLCSTTTYREGTALTPLTTNVNQGYDRKASSSGICVDSNNNAVDFFLRSPSDPQNSTSPLTRCGNSTPTPTITLTGARTNTPRPTATSTPLPPPPPPLIAINEFVPRPGHDWNNDGVVNVGDEYIELLNHGVIPVSLSGYTLDDEVNVGSTPYSLPAVTLQPGERIVFYGSQTGLLLSDGGDGVRLLKPNGQLGDAYNYTVVRYPDQSFCRLPDNGGLDDWNQNCFPTPGLKNALGSGILNPSISGDEEPLCPIADTMPKEFILAECPSFGNIWSRYYWDKTGWFGEMVIPNVDSQWDVFLD